MALSLCIEAVTRFVMELLRFAWEHWGFMLLLIILSFFKSASKWIFAIMGALLGLVTALSATTGGTFWLFAKILQFTGGSMAFIAVSWIMVFLVFQTETPFLLKIVAVIPTAIIGAFALSFSPMLGLAKPGALLASSAFSPILGITIIGVMSFMMLHRITALILLSATTILFTYFLVFASNPIMCSALNELLITLKDLRQLGALETGKTWLSSIF